MITKSITSSRKHKRVQVDCNFHRPERGTSCRCGCNGKQVTIDRRALSHCVRDGMRAANSALSGVGKTMDSINETLDGLPEKIAAFKARRAAIRDGQPQGQDLFRSATCGVVRDAAGKRARQITTADLQALARAHYANGSIA